MPKMTDVFAKEYAALSRAFDAAALHLKEAEQARAQHDQALREAAQALRQRAAALRAGRPNASVDDLKADAEVKHLLASLDESLARAEADRQRIHGLAVGGWAQALKGAAALEKELAADILARQKLPASKAGPGQIALANLLRLQTDAHKKLAPRRAGLLAGQKALLLVDDPQYFRAQRDQALAEALGAPPAPKAAGSTAAPKNVGSTAGGTAAPKTVGGTAASSTPAPANKRLTAAAFKAAGREARQLVAGIRASVGVARRATRAKKPRQAATARATAMRRLSSLNIIVKQYEAARKAAGDEAILALSNGRQLLRGIQILVAVRERARSMVNRLAEPARPAPRRGPSKPVRRQ